MKPKFNNGETKNPFHEFSSNYSSNFFLCVGYFSRKKNVFVFFPHLWNLAVTIEFTELLFSTCSRYYWNYCHFIFSRWCFRPEVSLSILVNCNVNRQGSEMEDHVQPIGLVFTTMREWFSLSPKAGTRATECIECRENFSIFIRKFPDWFK